MGRKIDMLRYFRSYDEYGVYSPETLQYWDESKGRWYDVNLVSISEKDIIEDLTDKNSY